MILTDLFEAAESPAVEAKRMMREWRDTAATEKYALTIDSSGTNASNAFPVVRKAGAWYGGVFIPRGGNSKEADRMLGVNHRAKAWIKSVLAPSLEKLIADGREVRISGKSLGNQTSTFYEKVPVVRAGEVAETLAKNTVEKDHVGEKRMAVYWWVSTLQGAQDVTTVNFDAYYFADHDLPNKHAYALISLPKQEARELASKIVDFKRRFPGRVGLLSKDIVELTDPSAKLNKGMAFFLNISLGNASQFYKRVDHDALLKIIGKYV